MANHLLAGLPRDKLPPALRQPQLNAVARVVKGTDALSSPCAGAEGLRSCAVLFLDIDDVLFLNQPYGGYDVALALSPKSRGANTAPHGLWDQLFNATAREHLSRINEEFRPVYVISSSWTRVLDDDRLRDAFLRGGLGFVVDNLHHDMVTPTIRGRTNRWAEISLWLQGHPEAADNWVVLDDHRSGSGLCIGQPTENLPFIVLCTESVGLTDAEYARLRAAFESRRKVNSEVKRDDSL